MSNRSRNDIIAAILRAANGGARKTPIQAAAYLSHDQLTRYFSELVAAGMLTTEGRLYKTTPKGLQLLKELGDVERLMPLIAA